MKTIKVKDGLRYEYETTMQCNLEELAESTGVSIYGVSVTYSRMGKSLAIWVRRSTINGVMWAYGSGDNELATKYIQLDQFSYVPSKLAIPKEDWKYIKIRKVHQEVYDEKGNNICENPEFFRAHIDVRNLCKF